MGQLEGKVCVVTGGASGIGARSARVFADAGAKVVIGDLQVERGEATAKAIGPDCVFQACEVSQEDQVAALVERAVGEFGRLDVMFNNAGFGGALGGIAETAVEEWDLTFAVLTRGVFLGTKHAAPALRAAGGGSIINTGSVAALRGGYSPHAYAAAKAAVAQLTKSVALELAPDRVRANCICPGFIATPLSLNTVGRSEAESAEQTTRARTAFAAAQPIARAGEPDDIAQLALWLASDASTYVTGQVIAVDGGLTAGTPWDQQPAFFRQSRPIKVYRP